MCQVLTTHSWLDCNYEGNHSVNSREMIFSMLAKYIFYLVCITLYYLGLSFVWCWCDKTIVADNTNVNEIVISLHNDKIRKEVDIKILCWHSASDWRNVKLIVIFSKTFELCQARNFYNTVHWSYLNKLLVLLCLWF